MAVTKIILTVPVLTAIALAALVCGALYVLSLAIWASYKCLVLMAGN